MNGPDAPNVRPLDRSDRAAWTALWTAYLKFYDTELPEAMFDLAWSRLMSGDPQEPFGLVAELDGTPAGLTHYLYHRHGWKAEPTCYLQDLYTAPQARGRGVGRALIEAVYRAADAAGAPSVYWLTQENNRTARQLYDRIARAPGFVKYQRDLG